MSAADGTSRNRNQKRPKLASGSCRRDTQPSAAMAPIDAMAASAARLDHTGDRRDVVKHRLAGRIHEQPDVAADHVQFHEGIEPVHLHLAGMLDPCQHREARQADHKRAGEERQMDGDDPAAFPDNRPMQPVVGREHERKHGRGFFRGERHNPQDNRADRPRGAVIADPAVAALEGQQEPRRAQHLGPAADVAHGLRHHRMHGEQGRRPESDQFGADTLSALGLGADLTIDRESPGEPEQENHVQHMQQHAGDVEPRRPGAPDRSVDCIGQVRDRTRDIVQHNRPDCAGVVERRIGDDAAVVVVQTGC